MPVPLHISGTHCDHGMTHRAIPFDRPFTTADLAAANLRVATLRGWRERNDVVEIAAGVFLASALPQTDRWRTIYGNRAIATGQRPVTTAGAALIHGLWTPPSLPQHAHRDTRRHAVPDDVLERRGGLIVPSREWTALQLARWQPAHAAVIPIDSALRLGSDRNVLRDLAGRMQLWPGVASMQTAIDESDASSESPLESWSRLLMVRLGLPRPELQRELRVGGRTQRPDFLWREQRVIGEADGMAKYSDGQAIGDEKRRQGRLQGSGYVVYRWGWAEVQSNPWLWGEGLRRLLL